MAIQTTVVGSYPKPPEEGRPFTLRATLHALERGDATEADLRAAQNNLAAEVIAEQQEAGIDIVTDGHVRWDDILTPFARHFAGLEVGGLMRWFDNNVYYRRPVCTGEVEWRGPSSVEAFQVASSAASGLVKAVIPGPVTFAHLSVDEHYHDHDRFALALARVLAQEAFELEAAGARHIQIDEPALLGAPEDLPLAVEAIGLITSELKSSETETTVATYFGDAKRLGAGIFEITADCFGFDLISAPENLQVIKHVPDGIKVQAGIVDARNTKLEPLDALATNIDKLGEALGPDRLRVSPSAGLEFLPRAKARAKLKLLSAAAQKVGA